LTIPPPRGPDNTAVRRDRPAMASNNADNFYPVLIQAAVQVVFWHFVFKHTRAYLRKNCTRQKWFIQWAKKPDGFGGETGEEQVIQIVGVFVQHWVGAICMLLSYKFGSPQLFIMGALSEFAYELLDFFAIIQQRFILKQGIWADSPTALVVLILCHHSGSIFVFLPACMHYADNTYVQQTGAGLLGFAAFSLIAMTLQSSADIYDLQERGRFTVYYLLNFGSMVYFRWIVAVQGMYGFFYEEWSGMSWSLAIAIILFIMLFKIFDLGMLFFCGHQLYGYMFGSKGLRKPTKISKASLKRQTSMPFRLLRQQSSPML